MAKLKIDNWKYNFLRPPEREIFEKVVNTYLENGYKETKDFLDYFFMFNPETCWSVRLYYSGQVQEKLMDG